MVFKMTIYIISFYIKKKNMSNFALDEFENNSV